MKRHEYTNSGTGARAPSSNIVDARTSVSSVKQTWQVIQDESYAHRLQNEEFDSHFDCNRHERRQMHGDIKITKEEQRLEDLYGAELIAQRRLDQEKEDARFAEEMQRNLELEDRELAERINYNDEDLARRFYEAEQTKQHQQVEYQQKLVKQDEELARRLSAAADNLPDHFGPNGSNGRDAVRPPRPPQPPATAAPPPSPMHKDELLTDKYDTGTIKKLHLLHRQNLDGIIDQPLGISSVDLETIRLSLHQQDLKLAEEAKDFELAKYLQKKERVRLEKRLRKEKLECGGMMDNKFDQDPTSITLNPKDNAISNESRTSIRPPGRPPPPKSRGEHGESRHLKSVETRLLQASNGSYHSMNPSNPFYNELNHENNSRNSQNMISFDDSVSVPQSDRPRKSVHEMGGICVLPSARKN